jgi:hypothetical protein
MILTTINSYFKPHIKSTDVNDTLTKWIEQGHTLETLEFSNLELKLKYEGYIKLLNDTNSLIKLQASKDKNFLTDGFHTLTRWYNGINKEKWIKDEIKPEAHIINIPSSIEMSRLKK